MSKLSLHSWILFTYPPSSRPSSYLLLLPLNLDRWECTIILCYGTHLFSCIFLLGWLVGGKKASFAEPEWHYNVLEGHLKYFSISLMTEQKISRVWVNMKTPFVIDEASAHIENWNFNFLYRVTRDNNERQFRLSFQSNNTCWYSILWA